MKILNDAQATKIFELAIHRLAKYLKESGLNSVVLGISGGIDSTVVAAIGLLAREMVLAEGIQIGYEYMFLDVESSPDDLKKARELAVALNFELKEYDLNGWYQACPLLQTIPDGHHKDKIARGNIKCKQRMIALTHFANMSGGVYLDTDDLSEELMGFFTRHGDEGDVKIIQQITKDEVYDLAEFLKIIPESIMKSQPGDGLGVTTRNLATDQLGLPYMMTDYIMSRFMGNGFDHNGNIFQLADGKYLELREIVAREISQPEMAIAKVLKQSLKTGFKRRYGQNVANLLPNRLEMGLPILGTEEFNALYLAAIKKTY